MRYIISFLLTSAASPALAEVPHVVTDLPPVHALVAAVMGDLGTPDLLLQQGASPHGFQLRPSQMQAVTSADLVLWIGPEISPWLEKALANRPDTSPALALLATKGTQLRSYATTHEDEADHSGHDHTSHDHDHDHTGHDHDHHDHAHTGTDPHAWLDPNNALHWTQVIAEELASLDPANAEIYRQNAAATATRIRAADEEAKALLAPVQARPFVTLHDAYGYFTAHYGLTFAGAVSSGDAASPGARHLKELQASLGPDAQTCLFPEAQLDPAHLQQLAEATGAKIGGALDPEGSTLPPGPDLYPALITNLAKTLAACQA
ncbi:zinc ABC transporter substrate-binding protein [Xinfangfangia sp. CPCC 101601]|uniref:High-affinity zinc uptake system protein ZnuA n=1 Tax=Pseudogemmobacter lacusdianii TaxID=3069608 RepID=A0ABU0VYT0_9RHOB|nr:zinc ABC transporter substrate-binding protein [Xinfangfangia sp. CPCC 101601]MDQ2066904.1 zinc ABC transporter substrate-binding protein [Xinfangfangia sp. CPCC 101601]